MKIWHIMNKNLKRIKVKKIVLNFLLLFGCKAQAESLLVAVLMVKNEEPVMELTLQPLVDAGITDFLIYDTGSTDQTIQVTQDFFIKNNITNFVIEQGDWVDFSTCRNRALELTEEYFPQAIFMLMLDAEWILHNGEQLLSYCQQEKNKEAALYFIKIIGMGLEFNHARLIRCNSNIKFVGKVHEVPNVLADGQIPADIYFKLAPSYTGQQKSEKRWLQDKEMLLQEFEQDPYNPRTIFYLAQTCFSLKDWESAAQYYQLRISMSEHDEENFIAHMMLAKSYGFLGQEEKMVTTFLQAFAMRPYRAEPLLALADYYYQVKQYALAFVFAKYAVTMPYPHQESLPVDTYCYNFLRYDLVSAMAYIFHEYELGRQATLLALQADPDNIQLKENLKFYEDRLKN